MYGRIIGRKRRFAKRLLVFMVSAIISAGCNTALLKASAEEDFVNEKEISTELPCSFKEGDGSPTKPYIIKTAEDLIAFSEDVNAGNSYSGRFIKQIKDIDLSSVENFTPIGAFGTDNYFEGTYLGGGHTISNLKIYGEHLGSYNNGLFGLLLGKVYSLGIESGEIEGNCIGSIASHTGGEGAMIVNCYSKAYVHGYRTGGIADNFSGGTILNSVSLCYDEDGNYIPLCSYSAETIAYCASAGAITSEDESVYGTVEYNKENILSTIGLKKLCDTLNENVDQFYQYYSIKATAANYVYEEDTISFEKDDDKAVSYFEGKGTKYFPYKINDVSDLVTFSIVVNEGASFRNQYLKQTQDIDLKDISFIPIGIFNEGNYFFGTYDGGGYKISNIRIDTDLGGRNNAFFGQLGGTAVNMILDGGIIEGNCAGSFASHSASNGAMIVNCYSTVTVKGMRSGGIADNFQGYIVGCWYHNDEESLPIVSYNALSVKYCYTNYKNIVVKEYFNGELEESYYLEDNYFDTDEFIQNVNDHLAYVAFNSGISLSYLITCNTHNYANTVEMLFTHTRFMFDAYLSCFLAFFALIVSIFIIVITLWIQMRRKKKNECV